MTPEDQSRIESLRAENPRAFPVLTPEQTETLRAGMKRRVYADGETLFTAGNPDFCFHLVESGLVEVLAVDGCEERVVILHGPGDFTGDVEDLSGRGASVTARAKGETAVWEMTLERLRATINERIELADVLMGAFIARWIVLKESSFASLFVVGRGKEKATFEVREFLRRNRALFTFLDLDADPHAADVLRSRGLEGKPLPVVFHKDEWDLPNPTLRELGERVGLTHPPKEPLYDLAIVGAGPAGLAAAVYGGSEGLKTLLLDSTAPGGQAGSSMRIENYLGFPMGLTGEELANRATLQTQKFGVETGTPFRAVALSRESECEDACNVVHLDDGTTVEARCVLVATGARYTKLAVEELPRYEGAGVYYAATPLEAQLCRDEEVIVVGGGNSAGQAAVFLAGGVRKVCLCVRGDDLRKSMSEYLVHRIEGLANVEVHLNTEVTRLMGEPALECVEITNRQEDRKRTVGTAALFLFIGASPCTDWLPDALRGEKGFVRTGTAVTPEEWPLPNRDPYYLETAIPGVFAAGDVRLGSVKRVASGVGEGAMAVAFIHQYLSGLPQR